MLFKSLASKNSVFFFVLFWGVGFFSLQPNQSLKAQDNLSSNTVKNGEQIVMDSRIHSLKNFPCQECHSQKAYKDVVDLPLDKPHREIVFAHMEIRGKCSICHNPEDMNTLRTPIQKTPISFNESQKVCLVCHGDKFKDWQSGIHGKQVGSWSGKKYRYTCVECHDPHMPKFPPYKPDAAPDKPRMMIEK